MWKIIDHHWRVAATGFSFAIFGLGGASIALVLLVILFPFPVSPIRKQRWTRNTISRACWLYVRIMRGLGLLSFSFHNTKQLKECGQMVIANHPSLLDVVFLLSEMPDANCIVKASLWNNPFTAGPVRLAGYIPNDNEAVIERAARKLAEGQSLIIFPEGTRTRPGKPVTFKRGFANIALAANCPITPVLVSCNPPTLQKYEKWYHVPNRPPAFAFDVLSPLQICDTIDTNHPKTIQVRHLTRQLQHYVTGALACDTRARAC